MSDDTPTQPEASVTVHAQQALKFTDIFGFKFGKEEYGKLAPRILKLSEPDGMSTGGGVQARQSLTLTPKLGDSGSVVCGWIDVTHKNAELRSYNFLNQQFEARYQRRLDLRREEFEPLLHELENFLKFQKINYKVVEPAAAPRSAASTISPAPPESASMGMLFALLGIGILIGFGLGYIVFGLRAFG